MEATLLSGGSYRGPTSLSLSCLTPHNGCQGRLIQILAGKLYFYSGKFTSFQITRNLPHHVRYSFTEDTGDLFGT